MKSEPIGAEPTPDPKYLVVQLSDLPRGWAPVPGETLAVPLVAVLRDPWSAGFRSVIRRERVAGYEASFWSFPERHRIECEAAVYRSIAGAQKVFALRARSYEAFLAARDMGRRISVRPVGEVTSGYRLVRGWRGFVVAWRYRNVLSRCSGGPSAADFRRTMALARLQQQRISKALG